MSSGTGDRKTSSLIEEEVCMTYDRKTKTSSLILIEKMCICGNAQ